MIVFISDAENAEIVLKSKDCLNKPDSFYKIVRDGLKVDGLFTSKGKIRPFDWRNERMQIQIISQRTYGKCTVVLLVHW